MSLPDHTIEIFRQDKQKIREAILTLPENQQRMILNAALNEPESIVYQIARLQRGKKPCRPGHGILKKFEADLKALDTKAKASAHLSTALLFGGAGAASGGASAAVSTAPPVTPGSTELLREWTWTKDAAASLDLPPSRK